MDLSTAAMLAGAGAVGGIVNAMAGGATLFTFPAMLAAGLPPIIANASNAVALSPGHLIAAFADRGKLPRFTSRIGLFISASLLGGTVGAAVLLVVPERLFVLPVPGLIAFATVLFTCAPWIQAWSRRSAGSKSSTATHVGVLTVASVYGGFFGAGLGIILTAALSITEPNDIRAIKALKNLLATAVSLAATIIFIAQGAIDWPATLTMFAGAIPGGYLGGYLIRVLPAHYVRWFVIIAGAVMTVIYAVRYW